MQKRGFRCSVQEGFHSGQVTVWVDAAEVEQSGEGVMIAAAQQEWRRQSGPAIGMGYSNVKVLLLEELAAPVQ